MKAGTVDAVVPPPPWEAVGGFLDPGGGPAGVNFSDGLAVTLVP